MCGIIGYTGKREVAPLLLDGLKRLEYRGYDSAGICVIDRGDLKVVRCKGKLAVLTEKVRATTIRGNCGIGHTRWATHGRPSEENAHPHSYEGVAVVHNGIIENYLSLKEELSSLGHNFSSETDSEVVCHLVVRFMKEGMSFEEASFETFRKLKGSFAVAIICKDEPGKIIGARLSSPLVVGIGDGEMFIASDIPAILPYTRRMFFMEDGEIVVLEPFRFSFMDFHGRKIDKQLREITWSPAMAERGGYRHFMEKEIYEGPEACINAMRGRISEEKGQIYLEEMNIPLKEIRRINRIYIVACGTAWHAGLIGKYLLERFARVPVEVDWGSEFRYRDPVVEKNGLLIAISQSGETADTIAALREGKSKGLRTIGVCNVMESTVARESDGVIYTHTGPEIGVAATKTFIGQVMVMYLICLFLGSKKGVLSPDEIRHFLSEMVKIPGKLREVLGLRGLIKEISKIYAEAKNFLYIARGINFPLALEGALKLKEISYIHAEAYPAGEMKHGPIALIDEHMPVVSLLPKDKTYEKMLSNIEEVRARGGRVIGIGEEGDRIVSEKCEHVIPIPSTLELFKPILMIPPLQLLAYEIACLKGYDVDQPRNLAKSVTVE